MPTIRNRREGARRLVATLLLTAAAASPVPLHAWTRPGHMVTAAIAYNVLKERDAGVIATVGELLERHPDRGPFQVAIDRETGASRVKRLFLECARWPDDARQTTYDHPSWHVAFSPVTSHGVAAPAGLIGDALEAYALNVGTLSSPVAPAENRAMALCWVMHLSGDIHQPLHTAQLFSPALPGGDLGGTRLFVLDHLTGQPISLHWLWDDAVHRSGVADSAMARAVELMSAFPESAMTPDERGARTFAAWREESLELAREIAYGPGHPAALDPEQARPVDPDYLATVLPAAERRLTLAGYRLAAVLRNALSVTGEDAAQQR